MGPARIRHSARVGTQRKPNRRDLPVLPGGPDLERALRQAVRGEVRFDDGERALYSTDASNYRQVPIGVVAPVDAADVEAAIAVCREHDVPVLPRGAGTSLAGQGCNAAVVLDFSRHMAGTLEVDPARRIARVQPGTVLDDLRRPTERDHGLTFGPDPSTHNRCTFGGMIGNNACGAHSILTEFYGPGPRTSDNLHELDILTYDGLRMRVGPTSAAELQSIIEEGGRRGEIYAGLKKLGDQYKDLIRTRFPQIPRRVSGYALDELLEENGFHIARALAGSEGTCVTILEATVALVPFPRERTLLVLGFPDVYIAAEHVPAVREHRPIAIEGMDDAVLIALRRKGLGPTDPHLLPDGRGWLLVEFGGDTLDEAQDRARDLMTAFAKLNEPPSMKLVTDPREARQVWIVRESGLGATAFTPGEPPTWEGWEDSAVAPEKLADYLRELRKLLDRYGYRAALYGHFGHALVHNRITFDLVTADGIAKFRSFLEDAADLCVRFGGSLSGEHGDGQARGELLEKMYGPELIQAFRDFKAIWDPTGRMNPGKLVDPNPLDSDLRLGPTYSPPNPRTHFAFPQDGGSFAHASLRCVGVGECRKRDYGVMCPSYMVTGEEKHSTRGRARLLFEMLRGETVAGGWRDDHVREALDLCLACKGCKHECPVSVDMATYKAEFLAHYYEGRMRPRGAYTMGLIHRWAGLASLAPRLANVLARVPGVKFAAGVAAERTLPRFAPRTFRRSWRPGPSPEPGGAKRRRVLLWTDTFNNHFEPNVLHAGAAVLETAGFEVALPPKGLCCGRPLYDWGMLDRAKRQLRQILDALRTDIEAGTPIVVLEPSCAAVFRDELVNLFPDDESAQRLMKQTHLLAEFLESQGAEIPRVEHGVLLHAHCHQRALGGTANEEHLLARAGATCTVLDSGCCGMAGAFGFDKEKYDVSMAIGERVLLPAVRAAADDMVIVTDGFSCREQIRQGTGRRAVHLAEVLVGHG